MPKTVQNLQGLYFRMASIRSRIGESMEDRYLSKGKRLDNGEWVQGVPFEIEGKQVILIKDNENLLRVHYLEENMWTAEIYAIEVDSSTICQCTGLKDNNGNLIWENDVVKEITTINFGNDKAKVSWIESEWMLEWKTKCFYRKDMKFWTSEKIIEVIGNIFDNPELLQ